MEIIFDPENLGVVDIEKVEPNSWNPKDIDTAEYQKVVSSLRKNGLRQPIVVREVDSHYEIIDGEQRWRGWKELGQHKLLIYNEGPDVSEQRAKELTIAYQQQVPFNSVGYAELLRDMVEQYDDLQLPIPDDEISDIIASLEFDWEGHYVSDTGEDKPPEEWETLTLRYPIEAKDVIDEEFARIGGLLEIDPKVHKEVQNGLILEKICVLSSLTPTESLE